MTEEQARIDRLLATGVSSLLASAEAANQMRDALRQGRLLDATAASFEFHGHMQVVEKVLVEAGRLIAIHSAAEYALLGLHPQSQKGGLPN